METQLGELRRELQEYERLRDEGVSAVMVNSIDKLGGGAHQGQDRIAANAARAGGSASIARAADPALQGGRVRFGKPYAAVRSGARARLRRTDEILRIRRGTRGLRRTDEALKSLEDWYRPDDFPLEPVPAKAGAGAGLSGNLMCGSPPSVIPANAGTSCVVLVNRPERLGGTDGRSPRCQLPILEKGSRLGSRREGAGRWGCVASECRIRVSGTPCPLHRRA